MNPRRPPAVLTLPLVVLLAVALGACSGADQDPDVAPQQVMARAKDVFDQAAAIELTLTTDSTPRSGNAVLGASGTLTHQPAFDGSVKVVFSGLNAEIPVVSVDGDVHAKLPLTTRFTVIEAAEYGAPDPADFADPARGISGLLVELDGLVRDGEARHGAAILTTYTGTLSGALVQPIIPSADAAGDYKAVVGVDPDGAMQTLSVTGDFFDAGGPVTYHLTFVYPDLPADAATITAP